MQEANAETGARAAAGTATILGKNATYSRTMLVDQEQDHVGQNRGNYSYKNHNTGPSSEPRDIHSLGFRPDSLPSGKNSSYIMIL